MSTENKDMKIFVAPGTLLIGTIDGVSVDLLVIPVTAAVILEDDETDGEEGDELDETDDEIDSNEGDALGDGEYAPAELPADTEQRVDA